MIVSISGKGGRGKTTLATLMLKALLNKGRKGILVVDADPATNLPQTLGVERTIGDVVNVEFKGRIERDELPPDIDKKVFLENLVLQTLKELPSFDLLAMGRIEAEGCYCLVNTLLTDIIDTLSKNYSLILMDMEAGLEHISRRTDRDVDIMLIITDPSKMGLQTARNIRDLARHVHIQFKKVYLVGNMFQLDEELQKELERTGIEVAGVIPFDPNIASFNIRGRSLLEMPDSSPAVIATEKILEKIGLI